MVKPVIVVVMIQIVVVVEGKSGPWLKWWCVVDLDF